MNDKDRLPSEQPLSSDGITQENSQSAPEIEQPSHESLAETSSEDSEATVPSLDNTEIEETTSSQELPAEQEQPTQPLGVSLSDTREAHDTSGQETSSTPTTESPSMTTPQTQPLVTSPMPPRQSQQGSKKGLIIGLIVGGIALIVLVSAVLLYFLWYQKPEKVVNDGIVGLMNAKQVSSDLTFEGSFKTASTASSIPVKVKVNSKVNENAFSATATISVSPTDIGEITLSGETTVVNDTVYFKATKVKEAYEKVIDAYINSQVTLYRGLYSSTQLTQIKAQVRSQMDTVALPIITELDNKWIKVTKDELGESSKSAKCYTDTLFAYQKDAKAKKEIVDLYKKNGNPFIVEGDKLKGDNGTIGYTVRIDKEKYDSYEKSLESTDIGKKLKECGGSSSSSSSASSQADQQVSKTSFQVWVTPFTHELKKIVVVPAADAQSTNFTLKTFEIATDTKTSINIAEPSDATSFDALQKKLKAFSSTN
ncbi:MAG: hypothetical protein WAQ22_00940 [Candidatus Saccharimonas sp.]